MTNFSILIVSKEGNITSHNIKEYDEADLYKKCGFTKPNDFKKQTEWTKKLNGVKYIIAVYGKTVGKANYENKYEFPPPIDKHLFFGKCAIIACKVMLNGEKEYISLDSKLWNTIYEKLMGGFEDLSKTAKEDEEEEDELDKIPAHKKTKTGYLKDGFVVEDNDENSDSSTSDLNEIENDDDENTEEEEHDEVEVCPKKQKKRKTPTTTDTILNNTIDEYYGDISLELQEEEFSD